MLPFLLLLLVAISLGAAGQIMLKAGLLQLPAQAPVATILASVFTNRYVFLGFTCYGLSALIYLIVIKRLPLSYAYPMIALNYVVIVILSWRVFGEAIPPLRIAAVCVILAGVVLLALSYDRAVPPQSSGPPQITESPSPAPDLGGTAAP